MVKITINGEIYSFDDERYPLTEAIELEKQLGMPFYQYKVGLGQGSALSMAGFVWLVLKRNGKDVPMEDILSGAYEVIEGDVEIKREGGEDPTEAESPTGDGPTSGSSPSGSGSGRGSGTA